MEAAEGVDAMSTIWSGFLGALAGALEQLHALLAPFTGELAWGLAIVALTIGVRLVLLPLGVVQARGLRARGALAPDVARLQRRFDTSERLRRRDPDRYLRNLREQQAAIRALHRSHGIRSGVTFGVLLAQSPVLFGLYRVLASPETLPLLQGAPFLLVERLSLSVVAGAGAGAVALLAIVAATTWVGQRQVSQGAPATPGAPSPAVLAGVSTALVTVVAATLPAGLLVYWATTGVWSVAQQALLIR
jgi:YidC/Oxa1 family membrane protein insertase